MYSKINNCWKKTEYSQYSSLYVSPAPEDKHYLDGRIAQTQKVLSFDMSLLYKVNGIHPHYWSVYLLTQLHPEAKMGWSDGWSI